MWPWILAGFAMAAYGASRSSASRVGISAPVTAPYDGPLPPAGQISSGNGTHSSSPAGTLVRRTPRVAPKVTAADALFAAELARIHEPNPATLAKFAALLRSNGFATAAAEASAPLAPLTTTTPSTTSPLPSSQIPSGGGAPLAPARTLAGRAHQARRALVGSWFSDLFAGAFDGPPSPPMLGDDFGPGQAPPGWGTTSDGWYVDPDTGITYDYVHAWGAYWDENAVAPTVQGRVSGQRTHVGDPLASAQAAVASAPGQASSLASAAQGALAAPSASSLSNLSAALPKNLPGVGQFATQVQTGASLLASIQGGSISSATEGGIGEAIAGAAGAVLDDLGPKGQAVANILAGAASGFAAGLATGAALGSSLGPYGAVAGAVIGAAVGFLEDEFGSQPLPPMAVNATAATAAISAAIVGWNSAWGVTPGGKPQGWNMADWCAAAFPPYKMSSYDGKRLYRLTYAITKWATPFDTQHILFDNRTFAGAVFGDAQGPPTVLNFCRRDPGATTFEGKPFAWPLLVSWQVPICSGAFWEWWQVSAMGSACATSTGGADNDEDTVTALTYPDATSYIQGIGNTSGPQGTAAQFLQIWTQMTAARGGLTAKQIVAKAMARRPSALWFAVDLYGAWLPSGARTVGDTWGTVYWDCDLLNAMATVLGMLSVGAPTTAICSELMLQMTILHAEGAKTFSKGNISPGIRELLDDYLYMAHQEEWALNSSKRSFVQWVAHYVALANHAERQAAKQYLASAAAQAGQVSAFRTLVQQANN